MGMSLHFISRDRYRDKTNETLLQELRDRHGDLYIIPEGGSNELAVMGVAEFALGLGMDYDYLCCPVGTGGTMAGLIRGVGGAKRVIGFSTLKGGTFLNDTVSQLEGGGSNWEIIMEYHFGGYAKSTPALINFIREFNARHNIPLEFVYTGKMLFGIFDLISKGFFEKGARILAVHTGGIYAND